MPETRSPAGLRLRFAHNQHSLLTNAADHQGKSLQAFIMDSATSAADAELHGRTTLVLPTGTTERLAALVATSGSSLESVVDEALRSLEREQFWAAMEATADDALDVEERAERDSWERASAAEVQDIEW